MKTQWAAGCILGFFLTASSSGAEGSSQITPSNELATITVRVYDHTHAKPRALHEAEQIASAILSTAGVAVVWLPCLTDDGSSKTAECAVPDDPIHLKLHILPRSMSKGLRSVHSDALGFALLGAELTCNAWIFYDRTNDFALEQQLTFERLLGTVIAHELGHLLLGENAHADAGLMHGYWSRKELLAIEFEQLVFSDVERRGIERGVVARREAAASLNCLRCRAAKAVAPHCPR